MDDINKHIDTFKSALRDAIAHTTKQQIQEINRFEKELLVLGYHDGPDWRRLEHWRNQKPPTMSHIGLIDKSVICLYRSSNGKSIDAYTYAGAVDGRGKVFKVKGNKPKLKRDRIEYSIKAFTPVCSINDEAAVGVLICTES